MKFFKAISLLALLGLTSASNLSSQSRYYYTDSEYNAPAPESSPEGSTCPAPVSDFRTFDGTCNANDDAGAANSPQFRIASGFAGQSRPNPRAISNAVHAQTEDVRNERDMSELVTFFGQFIDHNVALTPMNGADFNITVPEGDELSDRGIDVIPLRRSPQEEGSPVNVITSFIDGSAIYGSDDERAEQLRTLSGGMLKTGDNNLLPNNDGTIENEPSNSSEFFVAGDIRVNENPMLMTMHTIFVREHNIIATELVEAFPEFDDEELFLNARRINNAQLQKIVYEEWLPAILGDDTGIPEFSGLQENVEPVVSAFFSTAAFRVGHTLLNEEVTRIDSDNEYLPALLLNETFMRPDLIRENDIEVFIRGMANTAAQEVDPMIVDGVRNFLFTNVAEEFPDVDGIDLAARNIQRGRDHRIPTFNAARAALGLSRRQDFSEISSDSEIVTALESVYERVQDIDGFTGALAEDRVAGSSFGELLRASWAADFTRLRDGDRFFYLTEGHFSEELSNLPRVQSIFDNSVSTMRQIILETTSIKASELPANVFFSE